MSCQPSLVGLAIKLSPCSGVCYWYAKQAGFLPVDIPHLVMLQGEKAQDRERTQENSFLSAAFALN